MTDLNLNLNQFERCIIVSHQLINPKLKVFHQRSPQQVK